jgi:hypothetical protein
LSELTCVVCGSPFWARRSTAKTCSEACGKRAYRSTPKYRAAHGAGHGWGGAEDRKARRLRSQAALSRTGQSAIVIALADMVRGAAERESADGRAA